MQIFTTYPVTIDKKRINASDYYLNADGEQYLPFDGNTELETFLDETGERFYLSANGEEFYNAKGQKVKGFFKKVGGGVVKAGKFIGKVAKKVGRGLVQASKTVAKGVKTAGGKVKAGVKKLIHHEKKDKGGKTPDASRDTGGGQKGRDDKQSRVPSADDKGRDVFTKELPLATPSTPKENIVDVAGKKFDASELPSGKEVVQTTDESGNAIAGVEYQPSEVVAVTGADGNVEYHTPDAVGMNKNLKIALIVGGSLLVLGIIGFVIYKSRKNK